MSTDPSADSRNEYLVRTPPIRWSVDWVPSAHRARLRRSTADEVAYLARRRQVRILRMRGWGGEMTGPGSVLIAGGVSALDADPRLAERLGLTAGHHEGVDGYVQAAHVEGLVGAFGSPTSRAT